MLNLAENMFLINQIKNVKYDSYLDGGHLGLHIATLRISRKMSIWVKWTKGVYCMEMVSEPGHHEALTTNWLFTFYLFWAIFHWF